MSSEITIIQLSTKDLSLIAPIHIKAFPDSALTKLGAQAIQRYYEWQLVGPHNGVALGCTINDELAGFCFGGVFKGAMSGFLQRNRNFLALRVLTHPWLIFNPLFRNRLSGALKIFRKVSRPKSHPAPHATKPPHFGILAIAVHPKYQGLGVGKALMDAEELAAREQGFGQMLLSVSTTNDQAIGFYERIGWSKFKEDGVWNGRMIKPLLESIDLNTEVGEKAL